MRTRHIWFLVILALPYFVSLNDSSIWDANEAFYVQTPHEMLQRGDWVVPYFNGQPRLNKPPLSYWVVGVFYRLFGVAVFWERLAMALLAFGSVLLVWRIGLILWEDQAKALWAAGVFATTFRVLMLARRLFIDTLMLFCVLTAALFFLAWLKEKKAVRFHLSCGFWGLAFLAKGPAAFLPLAALLIHVAFSRRLRELARAPWLTGGALLVLVSGSWFLALGLKLGWDPVVSFFVTENLGRFQGLSFGPQRGPFFFLGVFMGDFFPWSVLILWGLWSWMRSRKEAQQPEERESARLLVIWALCYLLFFSLSDNKQEHYILPIYPAASLWLAHRLDLQAPSRALLVALAGLVVAAAAGIFLAAHFLFTGVAGLWVPLVPAAAAAYFLARRRWTRATAGLALFYCAGFVLYLLPWEAYKPVRHMARAIQLEAADASPGFEYEAGYYNFTAPSLAFYLNRPVFELYTQEEALQRLRSPRPVYMIVAGPDYPKLARALGRFPQIVELRPKVYTTARVLLEGLKRDRLVRSRRNWATPVYLITNQDAR